MEEQAHVTRVLAEVPFDILRGTFTRQRFTPHFHETYAIGTIERGASKAAFGKSEECHVKGDVIVIEPLVVHTGEAADPDGWSYRMFYVPTEILAGCVGEKAQTPHFTRTSYHDPVMAARMVSVHQTLESEADLLLKESALAEMLHEMATRFASGGAAASPVIPSSALERVREYLTVRYAEPIRLAELSKIAGISAFHLIRQFRKSFGLPPYTYLELLRVNNAKAMLQQGARISDVAFATGFSDQSHLTRRFKRVFGFPPGRYSKSCRVGVTAAPPPRRRVLVGSNR